MPKPARKRRRDADEGDDPGTKRNRPSSGDGDKTFREPTTKSSPNPSSDTSFNPIGVLTSTNSSAKAARNLTDALTTPTQSTASSSSGLIGPSTAKQPPPTIQTPKPTTSNEAFPKAAGQIHPYSAQNPPPTIHPPPSIPQRTRKRRPRATTPPETYTSNLPLVSIVPPILSRAPTGYRRGRAYWLINGVTRITTPILESVDALLEAEARDRQLDEAWNATLERAVLGVAWQDLLGEPPAHIKEILRRREKEEGRKGEAGNAGEAVSGNIGCGGEGRGEVKKGGDVGTDDGTVVGGGVDGQSYVDASCPVHVVGLLMRGGVVARHDGPGSVVEATRAEQAGEQSGEPEKTSGEQSREPEQASGGDPEGSGQASGEAGGKAEAVTQPQPMQQSALAPTIDPSRDLPGWVDYEARLVDPKCF